MHSAKILADSISPQGHRLTTFVATFPRIVLAELNTHRDFSRNSASSRAIPIKKMIRMIKEEPYVPTHWGRNQSGMQAERELSEEEIAVERREWLADRDYAVAAAERREERGLHKQLTNRLLEPFMWHTAVITATEWDNFFHLRCHPAAHPEIRRLAELMHEAQEQSVAKKLGLSDWHLPFIDDEDYELAIAESPTDPLGVGVRLQKISVARCARVSYLTHDGRRDHKEDVDLYKRLVGAGHMSPLEHVATPMTTREYAAHCAQDVLVRWPDGRREAHRYNSNVDLSKVRTWLTEQSVEILSTRETHFLGNFNGWVQHRKLVAREYDILGGQ